MPYIDTDEVKAKRQEIRKALKGWKVSVSRRHHSEIAVAIMSGPFDLSMGRGHIQVNQYHMDTHYEDHPEVLAVLRQAYQIASRSQRELVYDSDYGSVPTFYVSLDIGKWDRPFEVRA